MHAPEDVTTYPRPPRIEAVTQHATVTLDGVIICDTSDVVRVLETFHPPTIYLPRAAFSPHVLQPARSSATTTCEWKGTASYLDLVAPDGTRHERAAWTYPEPRAGSELLVDRIAVYPSQVERCELDGEVVVAQPGDFYGGWITSWITGSIKGAPGTTHW